MAVRPLVAAPSIVLLIPNQSPKAGLQGCISPTIIADGGAVADAEKASLHPRSLRADRSALS
jgi:hypothetical protein